MTNFSNEQQKKFDTTHATTNRDQDTGWELARLAREASQFKKTTDDTIQKSLAFYSSGSTFYTKPCKRR